MTRRRLLTIYDDVERRARTTNEAHPWWPCRRGCDLCCRRLAEIPRLTRTEWTLLKEGIEALDASARAAVDARLAALGEHREAHLVCPMLDDAEGACLVYGERPGACRTYGYYVERGDVLGCDRVVTAVAQSGEGDAIVWGNEDGVRYALASIAGEPLPLTSWLGLDPPARSPSPSSSM